MTKLTPTILVMGVMMLTACDTSNSGLTDPPHPPPWHSTTTSTSTSTTSTTIRQSGSGNYKVPASELNTTRTTLDYRADNELCVDRDAGDPEPDDFEEFCN